VGEEELDGTPEEEVQASAGLYVVKTTIGHEKIVADLITARAPNREVPVYSILSPHNLRGYLIVECADEEKLRYMLRGMPKVRGIISGETVDMDEVVPFLTPKPLVSGIVEGDIVELIAGPFKGEKARVKHIDEVKEEITVELFEAMISIPVTVKGDHVRLIEKEGGEE